MSLLEHDPAKPAKKVTTADVCRGIMTAFPSGRYAVLFEVADATGARGTRSADALIMSCWPSQGLELHGVEIKVSRSDWLRELKAPKKAETIAAYCDRWWLITAPGVIHDVAEVPPAWGWRVFDGKRMKTMKDARKTQAKPIDRLFLASVLRNAGRLGDGVINAMRQEIRGEIEAGIHESIERQRRHDRDKAQQDLNELKKTVADFEEATGISLANENSWRLVAGDGKRIGRMVNAISQSGLDSTWAGLEHVARAANALVEKIGKAGQAIGIEADKSKDDDLLR